MTDLMKFFQARKSAYQTHPRMIDDVLYTSYSYGRAPQDAPSRFRASAEDNLLNERGNSQPRTGDLLGLSQSAPEAGEEGRNGELNTADKVIKKRRAFDAGGGTSAEIFMFEYGTVVIWGMSEPEERRFLSSMCVIHLALITVDRDADFIPESALKKNG